MEASRESGPFSGRRASPLPGCLHVVGLGPASSHNAPGARGGRVRAGAPGEGADRPAAGVQKGGLTYCAAIVSDLGRELRARRQFTTAIWAVGFPFRVDSWQAFEDYL